MKFQLWFDLIDGGRVLSIQLKTIIIPLPYSTRCFLCESATHFHVKSAHLSHLLQIRFQVIERQFQ